MDRRFIAHIIVACIIGVIIGIIGGIRIEMWINEWSAFAESPSNYYICPDAEESSYYDDVDSMARLITAEAGASWCSDTMQIMVGSVVLNRMGAQGYEGSIEDVINQPGQYESVINGSIYRQPTERSIQMAEYLLKNGSQLPEQVIYAAEFPQGSGAYTQIQNMIFSWR